MLVEVSAGKVPRGRTRTKGSLAPRRGERDRVRGPLPLFLSHLSNVERGHRVQRASLLDICPGRLPLAVRSTTQGRDHVRKVLKMINLSRRRRLPPLCSLLSLSLAPRRGSRRRSRFRSSPARPIRRRSGRWWGRRSRRRSDDLWYRFRVRPRGGVFRVVRDFGPLSTLDWTSLDEDSTRWS